METSAAVAAAMAAEGNTVSEMVRGQACDVGRPTALALSVYAAQMEFLEKTKHLSSFVLTEICGLGGSLSPQPSWECVLLFNEGSKPFVNTAFQILRLLPPALHHNLKTRVIERFEKNLFSQQSNTCNLKSEIKKLSQGSREPIEPSFFTADYHLLHHSSSEHSLSSNNSTGLPTSFALEEGITYEQMQTVIEEVLEESITPIPGAPRITQPSDENAAF